jgi:hypothetical protein
VITIEVCGRVGAKRVSRETQRGGERERERESGHFGWIIMRWRVLGGWETCRGKKLLIEVGERRRGRRHDDTEREIVRCGWVFLSFFLSSMRERKWQHCVCVCVRVSTVWRWAIE